MCGLLPACSRACALHPNHGRLALLRLRASGLANEASSLAESLMNDPDVAAGLAEQALQIGEDALLVDVELVSRNQSASAESSCAVSTAGYRLEDT